MIGTGTFSGLSLCAMLNTTYFQRKKQKCRVKLRWLILREDETSIPLVSPASSGSCMRSFDMTVFLQQALMTPCYAFCDSLHVARRLQGCLQLPRTRNHAASTWQLAMLTQSSSYWPGDQIIGYFNAIFALCQSIEELSVSALHHKCTHPTAEEREQFQVGYGSLPWNTSQYCIYEIPLPCHLKEQKQNCYCRCMSALWRTLGECCLSQAQTCLLFLYNDCICSIRTVLTSTCSEVTLQSQRSGWVPNFMQENSESSYVVCPYAKKQL